MRKLVRLAAKEKPDVIHFQWAPLPMIDRYYLKKLARIAPLVLTVHNSGSLFHGARSRWQRIEPGSLAGSFSSLIVHTEYSRRQVVERWNVPADRVHVVPHGVLDRYLPVEQTDTWQAHDGRQKVLFFGHIQPYKGLDLLIEAFARLSPELLSRTTLHIVGRPGMPIEPLRTRASALGINDRIEWDLRFVPESEVRDMFRRSTVVALPYREIDQSGVLMTALAFEKPVVATRVGGFAETVQHGVHGYLSEPGDVAGLASNLEAALNTPDRDAMRKSIRELNQGCLSWEYAAQRTLQIYSSLCGRCSRTTTVAASSPQPMTALSVSADE